MDEYSSRLRQHHERALVAAVERLAELGWSSSEARAVATLVPAMVATHDPTVHGELQRAVLVDAGNPARSVATPESLAWSRAPEWRERLEQVASSYTLRRALWIVGQELALGNPDLDAKLAELDGLH